MKSGIPIFRLPEKGPYVPRSHPKKGTLTLPVRLRNQLGLAEGDLVDVRIRSTNIVVMPQVIVDRSKFPSADDEYTPEQRQVIDARLKGAEKTPLHGPSKNGKEIAAYLKGLKAQPGNTKRSPKK